MRGTRLKATMVAGAASALLIGFGLPAQAALGSVGEVLSNNQVSAAPVTYTSTLQVGVAAASVVVALPTTVTGLSATNVTVSTSTDGTTFTTVVPVAPVLTSVAGGINKLGVNLPAALAAGNWVRVVITGLGNPTSAGSINIGLADSLTALTQTTLDAITGPLTGLISAALADVGTVVATIVATATNGTTTNLAVAPVLSMAWGAASHSLSLTPSGGTGTAIGATSDTITVSTNAQTYSIQAKLSNAGLLWQGGSPATPADLIPLTYSVNSATPAAFGSSFTPVTSTLTGLTNSALTTVNYGGSVDLTHPAGTYVGTVSYLVVPTF